MSANRFLKLHRSWEDWFSMLLGVLIILSPWITGEANYGLGAQQGLEIAILNAVVVGMLVVGLGQLEYLALRRWEEGCEMLLALWLIASPHILGYSGDGALRLWHTALGGAVLLLAVLKLWQDWDLSDADLASHGQ